MIRAQYDAEAKAGYIYLSENTKGVYETVFHTDKVNIDLDEAGVPIGIELLNVHSDGLYLEALIALAAWMHGNEA